MLQVVADDMAIEKVTLAEEVIINNAEVNKEIEQKLIEPDLSMYLMNNLKSIQSEGNYSYRRGRLMQM